MFNKIELDREVWISIFFVLSIVCVCMLIERVVFLSQSAETIGRVGQITSENAWCGGKSGYTCTEFTAAILYTTRQGESRSTQVSAGSRRGRDMRLEYARYRQGLTLPIIYDPSPGGKAYEKSFFGMMGHFPLFLMIWFATFVAAISEKSAERKW